MQRPAALLINDLARARARLNLGEIIVDHGDSGRALFCRECGRGCAAWPREKRRGLDRTRVASDGEIGGEAFAQPDVVPVLLGDRIAKPLVRDLVRHQVEGGRTVTLRSP